MDTVTSICLGLTLAAACGLRVFLPLVALSAATCMGLVGPTPGLEWLGSPTALAGLSVAAVIEIGAYYIPWLDHALDAVATPAAIIAGTVAAATQIHAPIDSLPHASHWAAALLTGGTAAGAVQATTVATRAASTITTGGLGNWIVSTLENIGAIILSVLSLLLPVLGALLLIGAAALALRWWTSRVRVASPQVAHIA